jgi:DNA-binding GntR family transcriptional regulator
VKQPSTAHKHLRKLQQAGLVEARDGGWWVTDKDPRTVAAELGLGDATQRHRARNQRERTAWRQRQRDKQQARARFKMQTARSRPPLHWHTVNGVNYASFDPVCGDDCSLAKGEVPDDDLDLPSL